MGRSNTSLHVSHCCASRTTMKSLTLLSLLLVISHSVHCHSTAGNDTCRDRGILGRLERNTKDNAAAQESVSESLQSIIDGQQSVLQSLQSVMAGQQTNGNGAQQGNKSESDCRAAGFTYISSVNGCYKLVNRNEQWLIAGLECRLMHKDAHLLVIEDAQEQAAVAEMLASTDHSTVSGCYRLGTDWGIFYWLASQRVDPSHATTFVWRVMSTEPCGEKVSLMTYNNMEPSQPDGGVGSGCLSLTAARSYKWHDWPCHYKTCFVCELDM